MHIAAADVFVISSLSDLCSRAASSREVGDPIRPSVRPPPPKLLPKVAPPPPPERASDSLPQELLGSFCKGNVGSGGREGRQLNASSDLQK